MPPARGQSGGEEVLFFLCLPAKGDFRPTVQSGGEEAQFDEILDELGGSGLSGEDLGEDFVTTAQVGKTRDVPWKGAKVLIEFAGAGVDESTRGIDGGWEAEASRGGGSGFDCHSDDWYVCVGGGGGGWCWIRSDC